MNEHDTKELENIIRLARSKGSSSRPMEIDHKTFADSHVRNQESTEVTQ